MCPGVNGDLGCAARNRLNTNLRDENCCDTAALHQPQVLLRTAARRSKVVTVKTPILAAAVTATAIIAAAAHLRRPIPSPRSFRIPAEQLPTSVLDRLRHPAAPTYLVSWDRTARAALWRPTVDDSITRCGAGRISRDTAAIVLNHAEIRR